VTWRYSGERPQARSASATCNSRMTSSSEKTCGGRLGGRSGNWAVISTRLCDRYREFLKRRGLAMRQAHIAGDKMFVDYSGKSPSPAKGSGHRPPAPSSPQKRRTAAQLDSACEQLCALVRARPGESIAA
jgi:hypothetical protein